MNLIQYNIIKQLTINQLSNNLILIIKQKANNKLKMQSLNNLRTQPFQSLTHVLLVENLTVPQLFNYKNITSEIKTNIDIFVAYCKRNNKFTKEFIRLALNSTYEQLQDQTLKKISFSINDILSCDQSQISELFFQPQPDILMKNNSEISEKIIQQEELTQNIQSQAERLFENDDDKIIQEQSSKIQEKPIELQKYQMAKFTLSILQNQVQNESCLGYIYKLFSFLIRNNSNQVLQFFNSNPDQKQLLLKNLKYYSISNLVSQLLVCQDKSRQYKYEGLKKQIFNRVVSILLENKSNEELYDGAMIMIEEVFNNSKQTYYEYFEDFKRLVNYLVSQEVLKNFVDILYQKQENSFKNSVKYLTAVFQRINNQKDENDYYKDGPTQPTMNFQIIFIYTKIQSLVRLVKEIQKYNILTKISYITLLSEILKTQECEKNLDKINFAQILKSLMDVFQGQTGRNGLFKIKLSKFIETILKKCKKQQIQAIVKANPDFYQQFFVSIKTCNIENNKNHNKNEGVAFQFQFLFQLEDKTQNSIQQATKIHKKNLKRIKKNYQTKIANGNKSSNPFAMQQEGAFFNFNSSTDNLIQKSDESSIVGKNHVSIPMLNLPDQVKKQSVKPEDRKNQSKLEQQGQKSSRSNNIKQIREDFTKIVSQQKTNIVQQVEQVVRLDPIKKIDNKIVLAKKQEKSQQINKPIKNTQKQNTSKIGVSTNILTKGEDTIKYFVKHIAIFC